MPPSPPPDPVPAAADDLASLDREGLVRLVASLRGELARVRGRAARADALAESNANAAELMASLEEALEEQRAMSDRLAESNVRAAELMADLEAALEENERQRAELSRLNTSLESIVAARIAALRATNAAIERFVPREFLHALGQDDVTTTRLGDATSKHITVLFADIREFTTTCEGMSPEETFAYLNACLSRLGPHVRAEGGFVDKYIGDAIMALFPESPADAVRAAIAMQREIRRSSPPPGARGGLAIGVGVHVGQVMLGTIGEAQRFEATVISDAVNLTARLETLTKQLDCAILVSDEVHARVDDALRAQMRPVGTFLVKGRTRPVAVHEVFEDEPDDPAGKRTTRALFARMLAAFEGGELVAAMEFARAIHQAYPDDGPARWWLDRLAREANPEENGRPSIPGIVRLAEK